MLGSRISVVRAVDGWEEVLVLDGRLPGLLYNFQATCLTLKKVLYKTGVKLWWSEKSWDRSSMQIIFFENLYLSPFSQKQKTQKGQSLGCDAGWTVKNES